MVLQAIRYNNHAFNTKYCLCQMLRDKVESPLGKQVQAAQSNADLRYVTSGMEHTGSDLMYQKLAALTRCLCLDADHDTLSSY